MNKKVKKQAKKMKSITKAKINKQYKVVTSMMNDLRKKFFELELLEAEWQVQTGRVKEYPSAKALIADITKNL